MSDEGDGFLKACAFDIICQVIPDYQKVAENIQAFLERNPDGCMFASNSDQTTVEKISGSEVKSQGIVFACEDSLIFAGVNHGGRLETTHSLNTVENVTVDGKKLIIKGKHQVYTYEFKDKMNKVLSFVTSFFEMKNSAIRVKNNFIKPKKIKVVMLTIGSRGDVQPFISLALGMMEKGYDVKIVTHKCFDEFIIVHGIEFHPLSCDPKELMRLCVNNSMFSVNFVKESFRTFLPSVPKLLEESWEGCKDASILISTPTSIAGYHIAERLQIPFFNAFTMPFTGTTKQENVMTMVSTEENQQTWYSGTYNYLSNAVTDTSTWMTMRKKINRWRRETLGLPDKGYMETNNTVFKTQKIITLYCYSPTIFEKPSDWSDHIHVTGYWRSNIEPNFVPSPELNNFLKKHPNPVLVSFGSIPIPKADNFYKTIVRACGSNNLPVIICKGWTSTDLESSEYVLISGEIPYDYILPKVKMFIHHGGAGTTASCLYNKKPMIIIPFFGDQFFWGKRVQDLGIGHAILYTEIDEENLFDKIRDLDKYNDKQRAISGIGRIVENETGVTNAIKLIELNSERSYVPPSYVADSEFLRCSNHECNSKFTYTNRKHHCRACGSIFCNKCCGNYVQIPKYRYDEPVRVCLECYPIVTKDFL